MLAVDGAEIKVGLAAVGGGRVVVKFDAAKVFGSLAGLQDVQNGRSNVETTVAKNE